MPMTRVLRKRGVTMVVSAYGEVLFTPGSDVSQFTRSFSSRLRAFAAREAPANKRPRWKHYGKPLKKTMRATSLRHNAADMHISGAVGSTAPYAVYVDQGTDSFAAKILPPWQARGYQLHEATWKPPHWGGEVVGPKAVSGQRAQLFMAKALRATFASFGMVTHRQGLAILPTEFDRMGFFGGNTPWSFAFDAQLREWRAWRKESYDNAFARGRYERETKRKSRSTGYHRRNKVTPEERRRVDRERQRRWRERKRDAERRFRDTDPDRKKRDEGKKKMSRRQDEARLIAFLTKKYGSDFDGNVEYRGGKWYYIIKVGPRDFVERSVTAKS